MLGIKYLPHIWHFFIIRLFETTSCSIIYISVSNKQIESNKKIQFYDAKGDMYVIFKREEIQEKMHIKRTALDTALTQLKECNLIKEKKQGKNMPSIKGVGTATGMIESEKLDK